MAHARPRARVLLGAALAVLLTAPLALGPTQATAAPPVPASDKLVLAFDYLWYGPTSFDLGQMSDRPVQPYISGHPDVIDRQVQQAQAAGIDAFISSWTGTGTETDQNFPRLLTAAAAHSFQATVYFETNFAMQHGDVVSQLRSVESRFVNQPAFLHWHGKPVIFFWDARAFGSPAAWQAVRAQIDPNHTQIWSVDTTDPAYLDVFDGVHFFSGGKWSANTDVAKVDAQWRGIVDSYNAAHGTQRLWTADVIPGWDESRVQPPRVPPKVFPRNNGALYTADWQAAVASNPEWIAITSWNEWFEGTQIEPSVAYGNQYLNLTRQFVDQWKGPVQAAGDPCSSGPYFAATGQYLCKAMAAYWQHYGGLEQFGYPISAWHSEVNPSDHKTYTVQYFERARFELHPENAPPFDVELGLVGKQAHPPDPPAAPRTAGGYRFFAETGHNVSAAFYAYWQQHGGLFVNGYPISEELQERNPTDGKTYTVQYFERARFELHPENAPPFNVLLGFLGRQAWVAEGGQ